MLAHGARPIRSSGRPLSVGFGIKRVACKYFVVNLITRPIGSDSTAHEDKN